ncbi:hypothetical protein H0A73_17520 [Alcaligenaceae bacterium]|nr:hypothetical protein [Alcaligenaceae bacterium]
MSARNLRIVSDNVADAADITVSNTAAGLGAEWLKTEIKSEVCRILSGTGTITQQWDDPVGVDCVAIPAWNGSASSEIRVRCYFERTGGTAVYDSDWQWAAPGPMMEHWDFSQPLNVNNFADGATVSAVWVPNISARRVVIDLRDPERTFLDVSRVVVGTALSLCGVSYGSSASLTDDTTVTRTAGGDLRVERGAKSRAISLNMDHIPPDKRHQIMRIINAGLGRRHFFSGYASGGDPSLEQELMMYGVLSTVPTLTHVTYRSDGSQFQIEEW